MNEQAFRFQLAVDTKIENFVKRPNSKGKKEFEDKG